MILFFNHIILLILSHIILMEIKEMNFKIALGCCRGLCRKGIGRQDKQLNTYDYLADVPGNAESTDLVEVQFKNTRKAYYHNVYRLNLKKDDIVAVEASPGHDIGVVTLTGALVKLQLKKIAFGRRHQTHLSSGASRRHGEIL